MRWCLPVAEQDDDLSLLTNAALSAGRIARQYFGAAPDMWDKPGGLGPVTEADIAVDNMLREELVAARPAYGWLSEETEDSPARLHADKVFIVDPIDGTRSFIEGSKTWAHSLAIAEHGEITAAVVYLPMLDKIYAATRGRGAFLNDARITASSVENLGDATVLGAKPTFEPWNWAGGNIPPVKRAFRSSLAYRMSLVGEGRFDAMLTLRATWEWDIAAGALIVTESGGHATDRRLMPLVFNNPGAQVNGIVAGGSFIHPTLGKCLANP